MFNFQTVSLVEQAERNLILFLYGLAPVKLEIHSNALSDTVTSESVAAASPHSRSQTDLSPRQKGNFIRPLGLTSMYMRGLKSGSADCVH